MGGFFGVVSKEDCVEDLFYGTDYHSHLGTVRGGLAVADDGGFTRHIHDITSSQFRSKFIDDVATMQGTRGIGVISDYEDQPLIIRSHLGVYAIATVGAVQNAEALAQTAFGKCATHFSEMSGGEINPTELVATLINQAATFEEGIEHAQSAIDGSCSILLLTDNGMPIATVIVNQLQPNSETCLHCNRRRKIHLAELEHMKQVAGNVPVRIVESQPWEIRGIDALVKMGNLLWAEENTP